MTPATRTAIEARAAELAAQGSPLPDSFYTLAAELLDGDGQ